MSKAQQNGHSNGRPRAALSRGSRPFLHQVDQRTKQARRHCDLLHEFLSQIPDEPNVWQRLLCSSLADITLQLEEMRSNTVLGRHTNRKQLDRLTSRQRQLCRDLATSIPVDESEDENG